VFLGRVCRHLEQRGDLSVGISVSGEDALHLMRYVPFEVIVADFPPGQDELGFIKAVRARENPEPFIFFTRNRNAARWRPPSMVLCISL
jgi:ActR/RegA family two-component response regulator